MKKLLLLLVLFACSKQPPTLVSVHLEDLDSSEIISDESRLRQLHKKNFLKPQTYKQVIRTFKDADGLFSIYTRYHANGNIAEYQKIINGVAKGNYFSWHPNGQLQIRACVIGGNALSGFDSKAQWLFDGVTEAYNDEGLLIAEIRYNKGVLEGSSDYFYDNGNKKALKHFYNNRLHGSKTTFYENGACKKKAHYTHGKKDGEASTYCIKGCSQLEEFYANGSLQRGRYFTPCEHIDPKYSRELASTICGGVGKKTIFAKNIKKEFFYKDGRQAGSCNIYDGNLLINSYCTKKGKKHGTELIFYPSGKQQTEIPWKAGVITGTVKTWYDEGALESKKEYAENFLHGESYGWYADGSLMFIETYNKGKLVTGSYYRKGDTTPVSTISDGSGIATLFDQDGTLLRSIKYRRGMPS